MNKIYVRAVLEAARPYCATNAVLWQWRLALEVWYW